jgi:hypothetical protein
MSLNAARFSALVICSCRKHLPEYFITFSNKEPELELNFTTLRKEYVCQFLYLKIYCSLFFFLLLLNNLGHNPLKTPITECLQMSLFSELFALQIIDLLWNLCRNKTPTPCFKNINTHLLSYHHIPRLPPGVFSRNFTFEHLLKIYCEISNLTEG